jgi:hypothetical protein
MINSCSATCNTDAGLSCVCIIILTAMLLAATRVFYWLFLAWYNGAVNLKMLLPFYAHVSSRRY